MMETWHPLGVVGVISAFNFPVAVWSWNAALALVCGDAVRLEAVGEDAAHRARGPGAVRARARPLRRRARRPLAACCIGGREVGEALVDDHRGAAGLGHRLDRHGPRGRRRSWPQRFARAILELGGNNAAIVAPSADLDLALRGIAFAAMGTAGQRCTTLRRLFVHDSVYDALVPTPEGGLRHRCRSAIRATPARWSVR